MSTTRYVTGIADGILILTAKALDPEGNPIATKIAITVSPNPVQQIEKCYSQLILVSNPQSTLNAVCAQFGTALTYYIGAPNNTIYSTSDCSVVAQDAYYKLENGSWILLSGGRIIQQGSCATVGVTTDTNSTGVTTIPEFTQPVLIPAPTITSTIVEPIVIEQPVIIPQPTSAQPVIQPFVTPSSQPTIPTAFTPIQVFVPEITFTPPAPTLAPPIDTVEPIIVEQPVLIPTSTTTTTFTPTSEPIFVPAQTSAPQPVFGCTDPSAINYNPNATNDDGTCQYQSYAGGGGGRLFGDENINVI